MLINIFSDDLDYANYRARQYENNGSISATDEDRPRKRPRFDNEGEMENDTSGYKRYSSDSSGTSATVVPRPRLKRDAFRIEPPTFPEPPTNSLQETGSSLPLLFERDASEYCVFCSFATFVAHIT